MLVTIFIDITRPMDAHKKRERKRERERHSDGSKHRCLQSTQTSTLDCGHRFHTCYNCYSLLLIPIRYQMNMKICTILCAIQVQSKGQTERHTCTLSIFHSKSSEPIHSVYIQNELNQMGEHTHIQPDAQRTFIFQLTKYGCTDDIRYGAHTNGFDKGTKRYAFYR